MLMSLEILAKEFSSKSYKDAFLKASKWVATKFVSYNNCLNTTYRIVKLKQFGTVKLTVYVTLDEQELFDSNCEVCKQVGSLFFSSKKGESQADKCNNCKVKVYRERELGKLGNVKKAMEDALK